MMFKTVLVAALILAAAPASAKIWRVDNNAGNQADFTTLQAANDSSSVAAGDTLYVQGSGSSYGDLTLTKKLIIFGPGFFLDENYGEQANITHAQTGAITFNTGSENSFLTGLRSRHVEINASNITIKRVRVSDNNYGTGAINIADGFSNIIIIQSYITQSYSNSYCWAVNLVGNNTNIVIRNCYLYTTSGGEAIRAATSSTSEIINNVLARGLSTYYSVVKNNIQTYGDYTGSNNVIINNIGHSTQFGTANGNQENIDMATVFVGSGTTDGQWILKVGSPAIGAADDGGDVGMYGGDEPYVLSGVPHLPSISFLKVPTTGSKALGLPVQIKVRGNN